MEAHVEQVNSMLKVAREAGLDGDNNGTGADSEDDEWGGFDDEMPVEPVDHEEEYVDEDRFTTVVVQSVFVDRDGLHKPDDSSGAPTGNDETENQDQVEAPEQAAKKDHGSRPKKAKEKFRYETKVERQAEARKQKAKKRR